MLKVLISFPIIGIIMIFINNSIFIRKNKEIGMIFTIFIYHISLLLLLSFNNNNIEYQFRDILDIGGYKISLGIDGISLILIVLTTMLFPILILLTPYNIKDILVKLLILEWILLVLLVSLDLLTFYILFELSLIPLFILIGRYGSKDVILINESREITRTSMEATKKFFIFSLFGSLFMLISIILLYYIYGSANNEILSLKNYISITTKFYDSYLYYFIWLSFFLTFAIKIPIYPFHSWLPLAHSEANTIGSIILAAILLKLGTYGIFRYLIDIFYDLNFYFIPIVFTLSSISILYASIITLRQIDMKRIIAYSSIVHMNYSIISIFLPDIKALLGSAYLMISHGLISAGLFLLIGILYIRYHSRLLFYFQNLVSFIPIFTTYLFLYILNLVSLPFTSSFISELLILSGVLKYNLYLTIYLSSLIFFNTIYAFWLFNRISFGNITTSPYLSSFRDLSFIEFITLFPFLFFSLLLGLFPSSLIKILTLSIIKLI